MPVKHGTFLNDHLEHLFEAHGLSTQLHAIEVAQFRAAALILDRQRLPKAGLRSLASADQLGYSESTVRSYYTGNRRRRDFGVMGRVCDLDSGLWLALEVRLHQNIYYVISAWDGEERVPWNDERLAGTSYPAVLQAFGFDLKEDWPAGYYWYPEEPVDRTVTAELPDAARPSGNTDLDAYFDFEHFNSRCRVLADDQALEIHADAFEREVGYIVNVLTGANPDS